MIRFKKGDIFSQGTEAITNPVNCEGIMGKGLAKQFKTRFPENFTAYAKACSQNLVVPGQIFVFQQAEMPFYILNFPTKRHWRNPSQIEDIETGLKDLYNLIQTRNIASISIPPLGCGLGGLEWKEIRCLIIDSLEPLENTQITLLEP